MTFEIPSHKFNVTLDHFVGFIGGFPQLHNLSQFEKYAAVVFVFGTFRASSDFFAISVESCVDNCIDGYICQSQRIGWPRDGKGGVVELRGFVLVDVVRVKDVLVLTIRSNELS